MRTGRPRGTGYRTIRVKLRANGDAVIFIGRALYQQLDEPTRVMFDLVHGWTYHIVPGDVYSVTGVRSNGQPRFGLRARNVAYLGVREGVWPAHIAKGAIVWRTDQDCSTEETQHHV